MEMRFKVPKESNRQSYLRAKTEIRPLFNRLTPHGAVNARSPLVSMIFPSMKDKKTTFNDESAQSQGEQPAGGNAQFVKRTELEKIVELETKRRGGKNQGQKFM